MSYKPVRGGEVRKTPACAEAGSKARWTPACNGGHHRPTEERKGSGGDVKNHRWLDDLDLRSFSQVPSCKQFRSVLLAPKFI